MGTLIGESKLSFSDDVIMSDTYQSVRSTRHDQHTLADRVRDREVQIDSSIRFVRCMYRYHNTSWMLGAKHLVK